MPKNNYSQKRAYINLHGDEIKTLVMGNSLTENSFNTHVLGDSAYCLAISGRGLYYDMKLIEKYIPCMNNLSTVILPLPYNTGSKNGFVDGGNSNATRHYIFSYYHYFDITTDTFPYGWIYRYALFANEFHVSSAPGFICDEVGYSPLMATWDGENGKDCPHIDNPNICIDYLRRIAKTLEKRKIRFIVITPPYSDAYIDMCSIEGEKNLKLIVDSINAHNKMEYRNYLKDTDFREDSLYFNWNHLNHTGATRFAQKVKEDFDL